MSEQDTRLMHRLWIKKQRKKHNTTGEFIDLGDVCRCEICACDGNNECGHECLGDDCALDDSMICDCCSIENTPATDDEYDEGVGQTTMFAKPLTIYPSGPMTGVKDYNYPRFNEVAGLLRGMGHEVLNPAEHEPPMANPTHADYLAMDLPMVEACDAVVLLEGWMSSKGARLEVAHAIRHGKELMLVEQFGISPKWKGVGV